MLFLFQSGILFKLLMLTLQYFSIKWQNILKTESDDRTREYEIYCQPSNTQTLCTKSCYANFIPKRLLPIEKEQIMVGQMNCYWQTNIATILDQSNLTIEEKIKRSYSKQYFTPLKNKNKQNCWVALGNFTLSYFCQQIKLPCCPLGWVLCKGKSCLYFGK